MTKVNENDIYSDEIDLKILILEVWEKKFFIIIVATIFALVGAVYAFQQPNYYKSEATLAFNTSSNGSALSGQLGGIAALAGVNLSGGGSNENEIIIEILKSRQFLSKFISKYDLLAMLMASEGWDPSSGQLIYDESLYDSIDKNWTVNEEGGKQNRPSLLDSVNLFTDQLNVSVDSLSGLVKLSFEFYSPELAKEIVVSLVEEINKEIKRRDIEEATLSIDYLTNQIAQTKALNLQTMFYGLLEEQTKTLMLANVRPEYAFKIIDPAIVPERKSKPSRPLIVIVFTVLGGMLALVIAIFMYIFKGSDE